MKNNTWLACALAILTGPALAAVSPEEAARLGKDLTPLGAERAGNADGSIPEWDPSRTVIPDNFVPGSDIYVNPYPDEKPLYTVDVNNWQQYADILTEGTKAVFEKLGPDGFKIHVYPTKRTFETPDWYYANAKKNATNARLVEDGQKIEGNLPGTPFPIPQSALEVVWNHMIRYAEPFSHDYDVYYVGSTGKPVLSTTASSTSVYPMYENPDQEVGDSNWAKLRINYEAPARRAGEILLVHEPGADYTKGKGRKAWQYLVGQRRVRLAPAVAFDTPNPAVAGTSTYDDAFIWNGSPERYDWTLLGKKEMLVPNSNYEFLFEKKVEDLLGEKFLKPEFVRWEKHRVWVVEANLKEGQRHLYSKRRFYFVEDSWAATAGEMYDGRGNLWRVQYTYGAKLYDRKAGFNASYGAYDLLQGIYNLNAKPIPGRFRNGSDKPSNYFSPKGLARGGIR
tara:strand:+ start:489783 stop:491138 length:1356 start_codon:yes stop_codon:yes gene_type:complete